MDEPTSFKSADEMIRHAEDTFRKSVNTLRDWGSETLQMFQDKPEAVLGTAGLSGVVAGTLLRKSIEARRKGKEIQGLDPSILLAGGMLLGAVVGPRLIESVRSLLDQPKAAEAEPLFRSTGSMNERPFDKI